MKTFLLRPKPIEGEALTSYIYRVASSNIVSPFDVWKLMLSKNYRKPMASMSPKLNLYPHTVFDIRKFESYLLLKENALDSLTFLPVFHKFGFSLDKIQYSNFLYSLVDKDLNFCPECIEKNLAHKLIWQVKEIHYCDIHKIKLVSSCHNCKEYIPMLAADYSIDHCPYCNFNFKKSPRIYLNINEIESRAFQDWNFLLTDDISIKESFNTLPILLVFAFGLCQIP